MPNMARLLIATTALASLAGCSTGASKSGGQSLTGTEWTVIWVDGQGDTLPEKKPTITFEDGKLFGTGSCNRFTGGFTKDGASGLKFGPVATTMMACPDPIHSQERMFLQTFDTISSYSIGTDGTLSLKSASGQVMVKAHR